MNDTTQEMWEEYAFFTREMVKFFQKNDVAMFLTLQSEQEELYQRLTAVQGDSFAKTAAGQMIRQEIFKNLQILRLNVRQWLNDARAKQNITNAYDNLGKNLSGQLRKWNG